MLTLLPSFALTSYGGQVAKGYEGQSKVRISSEPFPAIKNHFSPSVFVPRLVYRRDYAGPPPKECEGRQVGGLLSAKTKPVGVPPTAKQPPNKVGGLNI
jgi:hypothetical protein